MVPAEQMTAYVSAQVHALRYFSTTAGQARDHWGFAWAPRNTTGHLERRLRRPDGRSFSIASPQLCATRATSADPADPGSAACGPPGQNVWCVGRPRGGASERGLEVVQGLDAGGAHRRRADAGDHRRRAVGTPSALSLATSTGLSVPNAHSAHGDPQLELAAGTVLGEPGRPVDADAWR